LCHKVYSGLGADIVRITSVTTCYKCNRL
jgi:hypothetical protein